VSGRGPWPRTATPSAFSHADNVESMIPRSPAIPTTVAPGVDRWSSTASRRNSSEYVFLAMGRSSRFLRPRNSRESSRQRPSPTFKAQASKLASRSHAN
jgi:hypothetical protein